MRSEDEPGPAGRRHGPEDETLPAPSPSEAETLLQSLRDAPGVELGTAGAPARTPVPPSGRRYDVGDEIARGGMGAILSVRDCDLRRTLAMKVLLGQAGGGAGAAPAHLLDRFLEEAQVTAQLAHPGVVPVHELGVDDAGRVYFTMSLVEGRTLGEVIRLARAGDDGWSLSRALQVLLRVCETMAFAHSKGVIHRDLKPANVMAGRFGEVYVMDWGLARVRGHEDSHDVRPDSSTGTRSARVATDRSDSADGDASALRTMDGSVIGTPAYMPPEQATGRIDELDERSDVYSLGAMLYELLSGQVPYVATGERTTAAALLLRVAREAPAPIGVLDPDAPPELVAIAEKAMARDKADRYESAAAMGEDLQRFLSGHVVRAYRTGALVELRKWVQRNRGIAATVVAALVVVACVTVYFLHSLADERDRAVDAETIAKQREQEKGAALEQTRRAQAETERALRRARAVGLAAASGQVADGDPVLSLLLAREAVRTDPSPTSLTALQDALLASRECGYFEGGDRRLVGAVLVPGGERVITTSVGGLTRVFDTDGVELVSLPRSRRGASVTAASPDGSRFAVGYGTGRAIVYGIDGEEQAVLDGHTASVQSLVFSPDGSTIATGARDRTARLWDVGGGQVAVLPIPGKNRDPYNDPVKSLAFSPDGTRLVTGTANGRVDVWRVAADAGEPIFGHQLSGMVDGLDYSPDGAWIAAGTSLFEDAAFLIPADGGPPRQLAGHPGTCEDVAFAPDGSSLLACSNDNPGTARMWSLEGELMTVFRGHDGPVRSVAFAPDGRHVATGSWDRTVRVWTVGGRLVTVLRGHRDTPHVLQFSEDGRRLLSGSSDGTARLWDLGDRAAVALAGARGPSAALPDGRLVTGADGGGARASDWSGGEAECGSGPGGRLLAAGARNGRPVLVSEVDDALWTWEPEGRPTVALRGHDGDVRAVDWSPDGRLVATASDDGTARIWSADGRDRPIALRAADGAITGVAFLPAGRRVVTTSSSGALTLWGVDGTKIGPFHADGPSAGHADGVVCIAYSPDSSRVATASLDATARVWTAMGDPVAVLRGHEKPVFGVAFSSDGRRIATTSGDGTVRIWDADGAAVDVRGPYEHKLWGVAWAADDAHLVVGCSDGVVRVLDTDGAEVAALEGHTAAVTRVALARDGSVLATGSHDKTARLWSASGEPLAVLSGHEQSIFGVALSSDARLVATASRDGTARVWSVDGTELAVIREKGRKPFDVAFDAEDHVVTAWDDGVVRVHDPSGSVVREHAGRGALYSVGVSPDGRFLAAGGGLDGRVVLRRADGGLVREIAPQVRGDSFHSLIASGDGNVFAVAGAGAVKLVGAGGDVLGAVPAPGRANTLSISRDGGRVLVGSVIGALLSERGGRLLATFDETAGGVSCVALSPTGDRCLTGRRDGSACLWDDAGAPIATLGGHGSHVMELAFAPDASRLVTSSFDRTALWDGEGALVAELAPRATVVRFAPDGTRFATGGTDGVTRLYDRDGRALWIWRDFDQTKTSVTLGITDLQFSPDGTRLLVGQREGAVRIYDPTRGPALGVVPREAYVFAAALSPDGGTLALAHQSRETELHDIASGSVVSLGSGPQSVQSVAFSPDGRRVLTGASAGQVAVWGRDGRKIADLGKHAGAVLAVAVSPDGNLVATGSDDRTVAVRTLGGETVAVLTGHTAGVSAVAFSPDGERLATGDTVGTVRIWDTAGAELQVIRAHSREIRSIAFSPDGRRLLTTVHERRDAEPGRIWELSAEGLLALADSRTTRDLSDGERTRFADLLEGVAPR